MFICICPGLIKCRMEQGWEERRGIGQSPLALLQKAENSENLKFKLGFSGWWTGIFVNEEGRNILHLTFVVLIYNSCIVSHMVYVSFHMYLCPRHANVRTGSVQRAEAVCVIGLLCQPAESSVFSPLPWGWDSFCGVVLLSILTPLPSHLSARVSNGCSHL